MSNRKITWCLIAFYIAVSFFAGCYPEDSLQWSLDGSTGIYSKKGALFLVDGNSGSLTQVAPKETTTRWPAISSDGSRFAYGKIVKVNDFNRALNLLPPNQVKVIKANAEILKQKILVEGIKDGNYPFIGKPVATDGGQKDSFNGQHIAWVQRYLVENADTQLARKIGPELIEKTKSKDPTYCQLVCAPTADPNNRKILATSSQYLWRIRFSPDSRLIAYGADRFNGDALDVGYDLYIVSPAENTPAVFLAPAAAIGYAFKPDSRAIAYIKPEDEFFDTQKPALGSLVERTIIDPNGKFLASPAKLDGNDFTAMYVCTGAAMELVGVLYYPWMHVSYACESDNRILFASVKMSLPSGKSDEEKQNIFCYDTLTGAVSEIMPQGVLDFSQGNLYLFALSHDSRKILLHGKKNTLILLSNNPKVLIDDNEGFPEAKKGENPPIYLVAQWKGPDRLSCLVSEKSHFLTNDPNTPARRKEIVILDANGNLQQILSKDWPDELLDY